MAVCYFSKPTIARIYDLINTTCVINREIIIIITRSPPIGGSGKTSRHQNLTEIRRRRHFRPLFNFGKCRPEVADDVISVVAVYVKFGDSALNSGQIIQLFACCTLLHTFVQYIFAFCSRPGTSSDIISRRFWGSIVPDKPVKFRGPRFNSSREMPPPVAFSTVFQDNFRTEVVSDVISGFDVGPVDMDIAVKFDDSMSNRSRDLRLPHVVTNDIGVRRVVA